MNEDKTRKNVLILKYLQFVIIRLPINTLEILRFVYNTGVQVNIQFATCHGCSYLLLVTMSCSINLFCANLQVHKDINCGYSQT